MSFEKPIRKFLDSGIGNVNYQTDTGAAGGGAVAGADNGLSVGAGSNVVLGQDVGDVSGVGKLLNNREVPLNGFNLGTSGTGTVVVGASIANQTPLTQNTAVLFGDSITVGLNASSAANDWATLFCAAYGLTQTNHAVSGSYLEQQSPVQLPNMVNQIGSIPAKTGTLTWLIFAFGINDVRLNAPNYSVANFTSDYTLVINAALAAGWPASRIVMMAAAYVDPASYPSVLGFPPATQARHLAFNAAMQTLATAKGCIYVDTYTPMQQEGGAALISVDQLHPNNGGHRIIAATAIQAIKVQYTAGQSLVVGGKVDTKFLTLQNTTPLVTPIAVLGQDGAGNVAPTNTISVNFARINNQAVIGNGDPSATEVTSLFGGTRTGYIRVSEAIPAAPIGKAMTFGLFPGSLNSGLIDAYDATGPAPMPLFVNWNGGHITLGGLGSGGNGEKVLVNGTLQANTTVRATGAQDTTSGKGIEMFYEAGRPCGHLYARDRDTPVTVPISLNFDGGAAVIVGNNLDTGTARLQIAAGTIAFAPLQFRTGPLLTTPAAGSIEFLSPNLFFTRAATRESIFAGTSGATAPALTAAPAFTSFYGGNTNALGDPNSWASVVINGTTFKIPLYT